MAREKGVYNFGALSEFRTVLWFCPFYPEFLLL